MSSSRYSIDEPVKLDDLEDGEDLVYSSGPVTEGDRQLLKADDEVVKALDKKSPTSSVFSAKRFLPKKKVNFGGNGSAGGGSNSGGGAGEYHRISENRGKKSSRPEPIFHYGDNDDYSDNSDSDIEIDLEAKPLRRRHNNQAFRRKLHWFLFLVLLLGGLLFFANVLQPNDETQGNKNNDHKEHGSHKNVNNKKKQILSNGTHDYHPTTILVSLDGFHPHYINKKLTPNLHQLFTTQSGVPYMIPSFPTSTFPNHWTLVTGLYPGNHGVVGNTFYDVEKERQFHNTDPKKSLDLFWWGGEPVWQTLSKQNIGTAVHMWPGSEAPWKVGKPMEVDKFNGTEVLPKKTQRVFDWIDREDIAERPELILTYVPTVDTIGHRFGISGEDLKEALSSVDDFIGSIRHGLRERNLQDVVNLMVVSDHGMAPTSNDRVVFLEDLVDLDKLDHVDGWPLKGIRPKDSVSVEEMYHDLKKKEPDDQSWKVFTGENLPREWHFGSRSKYYSSRIAPLWIIPTVGWSITTRDDLEHKMNGSYKPLGVHGYNNSEVLMRATFLAEGPYFDKRELYEPIPNVDVYNIVCDTLNANPRKNDGRSASKSLKVLGDNWKDNDSDYPGVNFKTEVLKMNSTYDLLFRSEGGHFRVANTTHENQSEQHDGDKETWGHWFDGFKDDASKAYEDVKDWINNAISKIGH